MNSCKLNLGHQEVERIVSEIDQIFSLIQSSGGEWLSVEAATQALVYELGYEDVDHLEDALNCSFPEFLSSLPTIETKYDDVMGMMVMRSSEHKTITPSETEGRPLKLIYRITQREDLTAVCLKSPGAYVEIPEMEFQIGADGQRVIDTIWNHISKAIFNLSVHISVEQPNMDENRRIAITEAIDQLGKYLDVEEPWTWILYDTSGTSEISPSDKVEVIYTD
uniref:Zinc finger ZPR1-type domain-containing protein n=1 Tax=Arcella intermedia TaxID=1963864 RepID=A0A6B2LGZ0_9EUKA